jgi:hypothetical protein
VLALRCAAFLLLRFGVERHIPVPSPSDVQSGQQRVALSVGESLRVEVELQRIPLRGEPGLCCAPLLDDVGDASRVVTAVCSLVEEDMRSVIGDGARKLLVCPGAATGRREKVRSFDAGNFLARGCDKLGVG